MKESEIQEALTRVETEHEVTVLYACESGSRAWGFASADSDFDVRFVYLRRTPWYLSIAPRRDVIEIPVSGQLDVSGWDLPKALDLFRRSNPPLLEWIQSPIVYRAKSRLIERLRGLLPSYYSPISCMYHYLSMADGNLREYLKGEEVWTKKYFYVLRPVLACLWIERGLGPAPTEFQKLVDAVAPGGALRAEIERLLEQKRTGGELRKGPRNEVISAFIEGQMTRLRAGQQAPGVTREHGPLDRLFLDTLVEVNGASIAPQR